jgi:hypothetical protein
MHAGGSRRLWAVWPFSRCTTAPQRYVYLHLQDAALKRMHQRATAAVMRLRRCTVEHPFATLKYRTFGHPRLLLRRAAGAETEKETTTDPRHGERPSLRMTP